MSKKNKNRINFIFKYIVLTCFIFMLAFSVFNMGRVLAGVDRINITNAVISDKSSTTDASITNFGSNKVVTNVKYHSVDEYVEYTITIKNNDTKKYTIKTITDNNTDSYIVYDYDKHENEKLLPNKEKDLVIKTTYKNEVTNINERNANDNVEIKITFVEEDGSESEKIIIINPTTGDNIWIFLVLGVLSLSGLLFTLKFKKINKTLLVLLLMTPFIVKAANLTYEFKFVSEIGYYDKLLVTVDRNGTLETSVIPYGSTIAEPAIIPITGYNFDGFYIEGNPADFSKNITKDTVIEARYNIITYNITYDLAGGTPTGSNPTTYTVESEFTLSNPTLTGYNFAGWTGTGLSGLTPTVTINRGTTEDLSFTANFSEATDTKYKVYHRYQQVTGDGYDTEEERGTGVTGSTIYPQVRPRTGFTTPSVQSLIILPNGSASIEYIYDRVPCTYEADSNTNSSLANGTYRYGTVVTVIPKDVQGYTFVAWEDGSTDNPRVITLTENTSVSPSYAPNGSTPYTVKHRYQKVTLDGYDEENVTGYGATGTTITAPMQTRTGFTTPPSTTVTIYGDGSGFATYTYDRLMFNFVVTDRTYLTPSSAANGSYPYGKQISVEAIERPGYDFEWLDGETDYARTIEMTSGVELTPVYTARTDIPYIVNHNVQRLDGTYEIRETEHLTGTTDQNVTPVAKSYPGFTLVATDTKPISGNGDTVFDYYYTRDQHTLTVINPEDVVEGDVSGNYYYQTQITLTAKTKAGYTFTKWSNNETSNPVTITMGTDDISIKPEYTARTDTPYEVNHHVQRVDGTYEIRETEHLTGTTDQNVTPAAKTYTGLTIVATDTKPISGNGDTVFDYYYTRDQHTLTVINPEDVVEGDLSGNYYYQAQITLTAKTKAGYTFTKWSNNETSNPVTITMGTNDISIKPEYTANNNTPFTVNHYTQKLNGTYELRETEHLTGTTNENITPSAKAYTGFTIVATDTKPISGNGDTVFDYYYTRNQYTLTVINPEDVVEGDLSGDYYYEEQITLTAKSKDSIGYEFTKWSNDDTSNPVTITMGASNMSIKPEYSIITYSVTFDENGGSSVQDMDIPWHTTFADAGGLPSTSLANHTFAGWFTDSSFTTEVTDSTVVTSDMTLVAKLIPNNAVAELNNNEFYTTVQAAVDAAPSDRQSTIKILQDVTTGSTMVFNMYTTTVDKDIILDLNNHTIKSTGNYTVRSKGNLIIKNGTLQCGASKSVVESNTGTLVLDNVTITNTGNRQGVYIKYQPDESGTVASTLGSPVVEIRGNTYIESKAQATRGTIHIVTGTLNLKSGTVVSTTDHALYIENASAVVNIGTQDGAYDATTPVLQGISYGVAGKVSGVKYSIYDGIIMGKQGAVPDESKILNTETGSVKVNDYDGTYYSLYYQMP